MQFSNTEKIMTLIRYITRKKENKYDHLHRCSKIIWQNLTLSEHKVLDYQFRFMLTQGFTQYQA